MNWRALALLALGLLLATLGSSPLFGQQPQAQPPIPLLGQGPPIYAVNAKYTQGVGVGYWPTKNWGLTLNITPGTAICGSPPDAVYYAGGTLTMTDAKTNYVYLDPTALCVPASNVVGFNTGQVPLAKVIASGGAITSITDVRNWFTPPPCALDANGACTMGNARADQASIWAPPWDLVAWGGVPVVSRILELRTGSWLVPTTNNYRDNPDFYISRWDGTDDSGCLGGLFGGCGSPIMRLDSVNFSATTVPQMLGIAVTGWGSYANTQSANDGNSYVGVSAYATDYNSGGAIYPTDPIARSGGVVTFDTWGIAPPAGYPVTYKAGQQVAIKGSTGCTTPGDGVFTLLAGTGNRYLVYNQAGVNETCGGAGVYFEVPNIVTQVGMNPNVAIYNTPLQNHWDIYPRQGKAVEADVSNLTDVPGRFTTLAGTVFHGGGLNDCTYSGTSTHGSSYKAIVSAKGTPDSLDWYLDNTFQATISMTAGTHSLSYGISITCSTTTGHSLNDFWSYALGGNKMMGVEVIKGQKGIAPASNDATLGLYIGSSDTNYGYLTGALIAAARNVGVHVVYGNGVPTAVGVKVANQGDYGLVVGSASIYTPTDSANVEWYPTHGILLDAQGTYNQAAAASSEDLIFRSHDATPTKFDWTMYNGSDKVFYFKPEHNSTKGYFSFNEARDVVTDISESMISTGTKAATLTLQAGHSWDIRSLSATDATWPNGFSIGDATAGATRFSLDAAGNAAVTSGNLTVAGNTTTTVTNNMGGFVAGAACDNQIVLSLVDANGYPNFLAAGAGLSLNINGGTTNLVMCIAGKYQKLASNVSITLTASSNQFIYAVQDVNNATMVAGDFGASVYPPIYGPTAPAGPSTDQHWFDLSTNQMKRYSGSAWVAVNRIFIGVARTSASAIDGVISEPFRLDPYRRYKMFGSAADGALEQSGGATSTVDGQKQYSFVRIDGASSNLAHTSYNSNTRTVGFRIRSQNAVLILNTATVTLDALGLTQSAAVGTGAGAAGRNVRCQWSGTAGGGGSSGTTAAAGGAGGGRERPLDATAAYTGGGTGGAIGNAGGNGEAATALYTPELDFESLMAESVLGCAGPSGGNGAGDGTNNGGAAGNGGGHGVIIAPAIVAIAGTSITAGGGNGLNGAGGNAAGAGAGAGGVIALAGMNIQNSATFTAAGGTHGSGVGTGHNGGDGGAGTAANVRLQ